MATTTWSRRVFTGIAWPINAQTLNLASLPAGYSILRVRFAWGFAGTTSTTVYPPSVHQNAVTLGIVTTVGPGTEAVPDPLVTGYDVAPPTQRWIWWEARVPTVVAWDAAATTAVWESSPPQERADSKGQVLAPGNMGSGNTLNLWASYHAQSAWDGTGVGQLWFFFNVLTRQP